MTPLPEPDINTASHIHMRIVGYTAGKVRQYASDETKRLTAELQAVTAERDALRADSERIDYLAAMKKQTHSGDGGYLTELNFSHFSSLKRMNLRNSISAAMKGTS